jgi:hypothetical protein
MLEHMVSQNKRIFRGEITSPKQTTMRACALFSEYMRFLVQWKWKNMDMQEANWMSMFQLTNNLHPTINPSTSVPKWALCLLKEAFKDWQSQQAGSHSFL